VDCFLIRNTHTNINTISKIEHPTAAPIVVEELLVELVALFIDDDSRLPVVDIVVGETLGIFVGIGVVVTVGVVLGILLGVNVGSEVIGSGVGDVVVCLIGDIVGELIIVFLVGASVNKVNIETVGTNVGGIFKFTTGALENILQV
jgi:hypothetical protein